MLRREKKLHNLNKDIKWRFFATIYADKHKQVCGNQGGNDPAILF
jgi:hypothetical protein